MKEMRALMWKNPVKRWHDVKGLFASNTPLDFMMYGTVTQRLQKEDVVLDWAGHMILEDRSGQLFVKDYQVFAVLPSTAFLLILGQYTFVRSNGTTID